jgi:hypothetical protein
MTLRNRASEPRSGRLTNNVAGFGLAQKIKMTTISLVLDFYPGRTVRRKYTVICVKRGIYSQICQCAHSVKLVRKFLLYSVATPEFACYHKYSTSWVEIEH